MNLIADLLNIHIHAKMYYEYLNSRIHVTIYNEDVDIHIKMYNEHINIHVTLWIC